jgi:predicted phage terminase large subunit-like protein
MGRARPGTKLTPEEQAERERAAQHAALLQQRMAAMRLLKARQARDSLVGFTEFTMPDKEQPDDAELTRYQAQYFHKALAKALEDVEAGKRLRLIITFPPRHGKSELSSKRFPAWYIGRDPYRYVAVCTYNQTFAEDFGKAVRGIMMGPAYRQVFPGCALKAGSKAADRLETEEGGALFFLGRGGTITGRGADLIIIDDPIKNSEEARSETIREQLWEWFQNDIKSRFMSDTGAMIIIQTRWHEDDLVGRITDPSNPHYDVEEAERWEIINIPAIAEDNDILDRPAGQPLWPERFGLEYLLAFKRANPRGFSALYQQRPTPEDGDFFQSHMIKGYRAGDAPPRDRMRVYAASDHAVGTKQEHDKTCLMIIGVDEKSNIWVLDVWWRRARTDVVVDAMLALMKKWKPLVWWAESGHISKSIGPFLYKRMAEEKCYVNVVEQVPSKDKQTRAQSIQGRMAMGLVRLPMFEPWYEDAKQELLKFPQARHDDFVDTLAHIGLGLERQFNAAPAPTVQRQGPQIGTMAWVKHDARFRGRQQQVLKSLRGM